MPGQETSSSPFDIYTMGVLPVVIIMRTCGINNGNLEFKNAAHYRASEALIIHGKGHVTKRDRMAESTLLLLRYSWNIQT